MTIADEMRTDLQEEVFNEIGKTVTLNVKSSKTYNTRGDLENWTTTSSSVVIVPYNITSNRNNNIAPGQLDEGDMQVAIPYTVTVALGDELVIDGITYRISNIQPNFLPDNVVTIASLTKIENEVANNP